MVESLILETRRGWAPEFCKTGGDPIFHAIKTWDPRRQSQIFSGSCRRPSGKAGDGRRYRRSGGGGSGFSAAMAPSRTGSGQTGRADFAAKLRQTSAKLSPPYKTTSDFCERVRSQGTRPRQLSMGAGNGSPQQNYFRGALCAGSRSELPES